MKNGILFQYFEWFMDTQNDLWIRLKNDVAHLKEIGVSGVWIPPAYKATSAFDAGYGAYDLYDLGEFDQKGSVKTKYGSKAELHEVIAALQEQGIQVYADVILNHKANGDEKETFMAVEVDPHDRNKKVSEPYEIEAWTKFTFPGRGDKYSPFKWSWVHFSGTDFDAKTNKKAIFMIEGINKGWSWGVTPEKGNYDYLMFNDIDYKHPDVVKEIMDWSIWFINETKIDGMRLDAVKHVENDFVGDFVKNLREKAGEDFYVVGEYWNQNSNEMNDYLSEVDYQLDLFDVRLHFNFHVASKAGGYYDMRKLFDGTLVMQHRDKAVTFVDNHDSQPGQALESWVQPWFKPLAYALILLRKDGYPCIFYGDYYGIKGPHPIEGMQAAIDKLIYLRNNHSYGEQQDYFDHKNVIGWVRLGNEGHPYGCAVVMSNGEGGVKTMNVGKLSAGAVYADYTGNVPEKVKIDENGNGVFPCKGGSVSVYVKDNVTPEEAFNEEKIQEEIKQEIEAKAVDNIEEVAEGSETSV